MWQASPNRWIRWGEKHLVARHLIISPCVSLQYAYSLYSSLSMTCKLWRSWLAKPVNSFDCRCTGEQKNTARQHVQTLTAVLDANTVYGANENRSRILRTLKDGLLKVDNGYPPVCIFLFLLSFLTYVEAILQTQGFEDTLGGIGKKAFVNTWKRAYLLTQKNLKYDIRKKNATTVRWHWLHIRARYPIRQTVWF